jgi:hypothetical protein
VVQRLVSRIEVHCRNHGYPFVVYHVVKHRTGYLQPAAGGEGGATVTIGLTADGRVAEYRITGTPHGEPAARLRAEIGWQAEWHGTPFFHTDGPSFIAENDAKRLITYKTREAAADPIKSTSEAKPKVRKRRHAEVSGDAA